MQSEILKILLKTNLCSLIFIKYVCEYLSKIAHVDLFYIRFNTPENDHHSPQTVNKSKCVDNFQALSFISSDKFFKRFPTRFLIFVEKSKPVFFIFYSYYQTLFL